MMTYRTTGRRSAAATVELALICPVLILLLIGLVVGGVGIFRYNEVANLAREAARYASVRGRDYERETGKPAATEESIRNEAVLPLAVGLDPSSLTCQVSWDKSNMPRRVLANGSTVTNVVIVTVSYQWVPEAFLGGITLSSTSTMPMSY